jgi:hypothetical protein
MSNPRKLFLPKLKAMPDQCVSCPFREGNDEEFGEIIRKLAASHNVSHGGGDVAFARELVHSDATKAGDFVCHLSAYTSEMELRPVEERRQCPGATAHFVAAGEHDED